MYGSAIEAFESTVGKSEADSFYQITRISAPDVRLSNGIRYCFVEVTCDTGVQYGIEAFDEEADKLYVSATRIREVGGAAVSPLMVTLSKSKSGITKSMNG